MPVKNPLKRFTLSGSARHLIDFTINFFDCFNCIAFEIALARVPIDNHKFRRQFFVPIGVTDFNHTAKQGRN